MTTISEASDAIFDKFTTSWNTLAVDGLNPAPKIVYQYLDEKSEDRGKDSSWVRIAIEHISSEIRTFGAVRRYGRLGLVSIQVFVHISKNNGRSDLDRLSTLVRDIFEGSCIEDLGIEFRAVTILEGTREEPWISYNITVPFDYDERRG